MGGNEQKYIQEAFDLNWIAPFGNNVDGLEQELADYSENDTWNMSPAALKRALAEVHDNKGYHVESLVNGIDCWVGCLSLPALSR